MSEHREDKERLVPGILHYEGQVAATTSAAVANAVPTFKDVSFLGFKAQHAVIESDIVIHFFLPSGAGNLEKASTKTQQEWATYWLDVFPYHLSAVAKEHFQADKPRLVAKYTEELKSWWFRARGYGNTLNPDGLVALFYSKLEAVLPPAQN